MRLMLIAAAAALLAACAAEPPDIEVAAELELGVVTKGEKARASTPVRNLGGQVLKVLAVSTSCGCTKASVTPAEVPPGGEGVLWVEYDSNAHEADMGEIERFAFIATNDPDEDDVPVKLRVVVREPAS